MIWNENAKSELLRIGAAKAKLGYLLKMVSMVKVDFFWSIHASGQL